MDMVGDAAHTNRVAPEFAYRSTQLTVDFFELLNSKKVVAVLGAKDHVDV